MADSPEVQLIKIVGLPLGLSSEIPATIDWNTIRECARKNRVLPILYSAISDQPHVPDHVLQNLRQETQRSFVATTLLAQVMEDVATALGNISWMLLRGPVLGEFVYGNLSLRPYGDLDVLVSPTSVHAALVQLNAAGFLPPIGSFPISFYQKYHLHIQLSRAGLAGNASVELHWALDHPFTLLTVDIDEMLKRREMMSIDHLFVAHPSLEDLVVSLAIHTVKHAAPLRQWIAQQDPYIFAAHGMLLHFYDIATLLKKYEGSLDWDVIRERSQQWGASDLLNLCFQGIQLLWPGVMPTEAVAEGPFHADQRRQSAPPSGRISKREEFAFAQIRGAIFRPIRVVDALIYVMPPQSFLARCYGSSALVVRIKHTTQALFQLTAGAISLLYHSIRTRMQHFIRILRDVETQSP